MADDDRRDERIGAWLETEPLDDVTRRRLVSTALRERDAGPERQGPSRALRWIATAAAIVALLVGGLALFTARGGNDEQRASAPVHTPEEDGGSARSSGGLADTAAPQAAQVAPVDVGDFGDLSRAANLARARTALERGLAPAAADSTSKSAATPDAESPAPGGAGASLPTLACADRLPDGVVTAVARGTLDGRPAIVALTVLPDGNRSVDAVLSDPCEVRPLS